MAVQGTGSAGMRHMSVLAQMEHVCPIAIPKRPGRRSELDTLGYRTARSVKEAADLGAGLCIVATNTDQHAADAHFAIEAGLDVLIEKPISSTSCSAAELVRAASGAERSVFVGCQLRFSESLDRFRSQLSAIGSIHRVGIECGSFLPDWRTNRPYRESYSAQPEQGGVLRDLIHEIDYATWLFGWPDAVEARIRNLGRLGIESDEVAQLNWEVSDGCLVSIDLDYLTRPPRRNTTAFGQDGVLEWDAIEGTVRLTRPDGFEQSSHPERHDDLFALQDRAFFNTHTAQVDPRLATGADGVNALAVCDSARRASEDHSAAAVAYS